MEDYPVEPMGKAETVKDKSHVRLYDQEGIKRLKPSQVNVGDVFWG